jgi:hypothetical protein
MRWSLIWLSALLLANAPGASAQSVARMATWNLAWMLDKATFERWSAACEALNWADGASPSDTTLPFCDVHSGMAWPLKACLRNQAGGQAPLPKSRYPQEHACRTSKDLRTWPAFMSKVEAIRGVVRQLKRDGVTVVALQEVSSADAARLVFPPEDGWQVATTAETKSNRQHRIAQHVGVAYQNSAGVENIGVLDDLAVQGKDGRFTRPGLTFSMPINGRSTTWLVVHLKAGCRSQVISEPGAARTFPDDKNEPAEEYDARNARLQNDCAALRLQVPVLENWLDTQLGRDRNAAVGMVGDFNRSILNELGKPARIDDKESAAAPITLDTKIARLLPELSDGAPPGARLTVVRPNYKGVSQREVCGTRRGTQGIDLFLLSSGLARLLQSSSESQARIASTVMPFGDAAYGPDKALVSDHCPHVLDLGKS